MNTKSFFAGIASALIIAGIAIGGYFLGKGTSIKPEISPTPTQTQPGSLTIPDAQDVIVSPTQAPASIDEENLIDAVKSKNYAALVGYMTNPVSVRLEASECCQPMIPDDAAAQLEYLNNAEGTWDFENDEIISGLQSSFPEHYGEAIIGVSSDNYLVAFQLNEQGVISKISMAVDYNLLLP